MKLTPGLAEMISNVPPELDSLEQYVQPFVNFLKENAKEGDIVLIQGEIGIVVIMVQFCWKMKLDPIYATTSRKVIEIKKDDGTVEKKSTFEHILFRHYERS